VNSIDLQQTGGTVPKKTAVKKVAKKATKKAPAKKAVKKVAKKAPAKKAPAKKVVAKKGPAKKAAPAKRSPNIVKPTLAKSAKKVVGKPFPAKLQSTTKGNSTTITVTPNEVAIKEVLVEERRLTMLPPPRLNKTVKKGVGLKPIKSAPAPLIISDRSELSKDLRRLRAELAEVESGMEDLINAEGMGAGDDQADAGTKTFEREHEMSLVYNARDMVIQTERALERIDNKTYGRCEECENSIGKARLQVFPRATLCMSCKQKEERR
jgi:DnaK suppressor protein